MPQDIASYLQTHTDINYVFEAFDGLDGGVAKALQSAGLSSKVKIVGTQAGSTQMQEIIAGTEAAWTALPQELAMWTIADQMATTGGQPVVIGRRAAVGRPALLHRVARRTRRKVLVGLKDGWAGPTGFQDAFKKLWGV